MESSIVRALFDALNESGTLYCHWKSTDHLAASFEAKTDLDVLFSRSVLNDVEAILSVLGFVRTRTPDARTYPCVEDYICFDESLQRWVHLHAHFQLPIGDRWTKGYRIPLENYLLSNRTFNEQFGLYTIDPCSEYLMFIHRMYMKWTFPRSKKSFLKENSWLTEYLLSNGISEEKLENNLLYDVRFRKIYVSLYRNKIKKIRLLDEIYFKLCNLRYLRSSYVVFPVSIFYRYIYRLLIEFNRRFISNFTFGRRTLVSGGRGIVLVGMDGSGKTSMISKSERFFSKQLNVGTVFFGSGRSGSGPLRKAIFFIHDMISNNKDIKTGENHSETKQNKGAKPPSLLKLGWIYLCNRDRKKQLRRYNRLISNGSIVLVDRMPQSVDSEFADAPKLAEHLESNNFLVRYVSNHENHLYKQFGELECDAFIWLDISPEISLIRKPNELNIEQAKSYRLAMEHLTTHHFKNVLTIDADLDFDTVLSKVLCGIWKQLK